MAFGGILKLVEMLKAATAILFASFYDVQSFYERE